MKLKRFHFGKSTKNVKNHADAHKQQDAFCKSKGGQLPQREELCPNYARNKASTPALGCENSHSWVPYAGSTDQWMYIGCPHTGALPCKDHMAHHNEPRWPSGDQYGDKIDCMVPAKQSSSNAGSNSGTF